MICYVQVDYLKVTSSVYEGKGTYLPKVGTFVGTWYEGT